MVAKLKNEFGDANAKNTTVYKFIPKVCKLCLKRISIWATSEICTQFAELHISRFSICNEKGLISLHMYINQRKSIKKV